MNLFGSSKVDQLPLLRIDFGLRDSFHSPESTVDSSAIDIPNLEDCASKRDVKYSVL